MEGKFKKGDWIATDKQYVTQIASVEEDGYCTIYQGFIPFVDEKYWHLWNLQDAKDGDVLYFSDETIVIFKDLYNATTFHSYCHIEDGEFGISCEALPDWWEGKEFQPATKEQRDLLFQKIKEAGYEWDAEKKELKVKPKFEVGDWLVHNERKHIVKVVNHTPLDYEVVNILGYHHTVTDTAIENNYHLWSIADAKDGDVLAVEDKNFITPFVAIYKERGLDFFNSHCFIGFDGNFYKGEEGHSTENIHPATTEQRDLLFQKMKEAGWEWDAENKELKKTQRRISAEVKEALYDSSLFGEDEKECDTLEDKINELHERYPEISFAKLSRICVSVSKWQKKKIFEDFKGD